MAPPQSEVWHVGTDLEDVEVRPSHIELAHPELVAHCLSVLDEAMTAKDHCFHRPRRYFLEGKEKCQSEANRLAEYPQMCGGGLDSGPREELIWKEDEVSLVVVVAVGAEQQRRHVQKEAVVDCN
jgi:hypothetical protein